MCPGHGMLLATRTNRVTSLSQKCHGLCVALNIWLIFLCTYAIKIILVWLAVNPGVYVKWVVKHHTDQNMV